MGNTGMRSLVGMARMVGRRVELRDGVLRQFVEREGVILAAYVSDTVTEGWEWGLVDEKARQSCTRVMLVVDMGNYDVVDVPLFGVLVKA